MKDYFTGLFNYDKYANELITSAIFKTDDRGNAVNLMAHLLVAQQLWLGRCKGLLPRAIELWPEGNADDFEAIIADNHKNWIAFLESCSADDFDKPVIYKTTKGVEYKDKLADILAHVINHGTHHRAQAGQQLKINGFTTLPATDYIFYLRQLNSQP